MIFFLAIDTLCVVCSIYLIYKIAKSNIAIQKEYGECFKVEKKYRQQIPFKFKFLSKNKIIELMPILCNKLELPNIDKLILKRWIFGWVFSSISGEYSIWDGKSILKLKRGIWYYSGITLIHELTHHYDACYGICLGHGTIFCANEEKVFQSFIKLITSGV